MQWELSRAGYISIAGHEACYLFTYPDPGTGGEPWTIGIGHTAAAGGYKPVPGDRLTLQQAIDIFKQGMKKFETGVNNAIKPGKITSQHMFDGLVSFHFNTGAIKTGSVDDCINRGDIPSAMKILNQYVNAGGKRLQGLVNRRKEETEIILHGKYPKRRTLVKDYPGHKGRYVDLQLGDAIETGDIKTPELVRPEPRKSENFILDLLKLIWRFFDDKKTC